ncbi:MAG: hypothetical protein HQL58_04310 [Magnetococcales bacterium]|nr:hypothetical protein [Magnetococcales bacterium]
MKIYFNHQIHHIEQLYDGYEDRPGLELTVHLHRWQFPDQTGAGVGWFRVEIREQPIETQTSRRPMIGSGLIEASAAALLSWQGESPLIQAMLDGLCSHGAVHDFFRSAAAAVLTLPDPPTQRIGSERSVPARAFYNPALHRA